MLRKKNTKQKLYTCSVACVHSMCVYMWTISYLIFANGNGINIHIKELRRRHNKREERKSGENEI